MCTHTHTHTHTDSPSAPSHEVSHAVKVWQPLEQPLEEDENVIDGYLELACSPAVLYAGRNKEYALHLLYHVGGSVKVSHHLPVERALLPLCVCWYHWRRL